MEKERLLAICDSLAWLLPSEEIANALIWGGV